VDDFSHVYISPDAKRGRNVASARISQFLQVDLV
jgi:hypothetical protein